MVFVGFFETISQICVVFWNHNRFQLITSTCREDKYTDETAVLRNQQPKGNFTLGRVIIVFASVEGFAVVRNVALTTHCQTVVYLVARPFHTAFACVLAEGFGRSREQFLQFLCFCIN